MIDWLAGLAVKHPWIVNIPTDVCPLFLCFVFYVIGLRRVPYCWPGKLGEILKLCYQVGTVLIMMLCVMASVYSAMQTGLGRHTGLDHHPVYFASWMVVGLFVIVPCIFRDENTKREKRKRMEIRATDKL